MGKMEQRKVRKRETNLTQATIRRLRETTHCVRHFDILKLLLLKKLFTYKLEGRGYRTHYSFVNILGGKKEKGSLGYLLCTFRIHAVDKL